MEIIAYVLLSIKYKIKISAQNEPDSVYYFVVPKILNNCNIFGIPFKETVETF